MLADGGGMTPSDHGTPPRDPGSETLHYAERAGNQE